MKSFGMERLVRWLPDLVISAIVLVMLFQLWRWGRETSTQGRRTPRGVDLLPIVAAGYILLSVAMKSSRIGDYLDTWWRSWIRAGGLILGFLVIGTFVSAFLWRRMPSFQPERRRLLVTTRAALFAAPVAVAGFGIFVERNHFHLREVDLPIRGLPRDLSGLRLVQISDIHLSPFLSERDLAYVVEMANETNADVALVTGDLISNPGDPVEACLRRLSHLRSPNGIWGCMGNHEIYARVSDYAAIRGAQFGIRFLRSENVCLRFGQATLNLAGVDYQRRDEKYLVGAEELLQPGAVNVLLSHNPDVFPVAARQGFHAVLSGHTHGGQVSVEILSQQVNVARFFTPFVYGLYSLSGSSIYVTRGIGTIGMPIRLGAPPEVALIRLCAT